MNPYLLEITYFDGIKHKRHILVYAKNFREAKERTNKQLKNGDSDIVYHVDNNTFVVNDFETEEQEKTCHPLAQKQ